MASHFGQDRVGWKPSVKSDRDFIKESAESRPAG